MRHLFLALLLLLPLHAHSQTPSISRYLVFDLADGTNQVKTTFSESGNHVYAVGEFSDSLVIGGFRLTSRGSFDGFVLALTADLTPLWILQFGGPGDDAATCVASTRNGNVAVGAYCGANTATITTYTIGSVTYSGRGDADAAVMMIDSLGNVLWSRNDGGTGPDGVVEIIETPSQELLLTGYFTSVARFDTTSVGLNNGLQHTYFQLLESNGNQRSANALVALPFASATSRVSPSRVFVDSDNGYIPVLYDGAVLFGTDTLIRITKSARPQTFVKFRLPSLSIVGVDSVNVCYDAASTWYSPNNGAFTTDPDICETDEPPHTTWIHDNSTDRIVDGKMSLTYGSVGTQINQPTFVGAYSDTLHMVYRGNGDLVVCSNTAYDGIAVISTNSVKGIELLPLGTTIRGILHNVSVSPNGIIVSGRAEGSVAALPTAPTLTWNQQLIAYIPHTVSSVSTPVNVTPAMCDYFSVYDITGKQIGASDMPVSRIRTLQEGMYVLSCSKGLSLCYVGSNSLSFAIPATASR